MNHPTSILLHPTRRELLFLLHAEPGLCFRQLVRRTGVASGTLAHHLSQLRRHGQVWSIPLGERIHHFASPKPEEGVIKRLLADSVLPPLDQAILALLRTEGPCRQVKILDRLQDPKIARSIVQHHLYRLRERGFIRETRQGRYVQYEARV